ncbi:MAG: DNA-protecting protein DprA [Deltaproteobacteria bacterium]|nr:DNA-protecting protein DprA [Deltaproteobacteria bacterium]
MEAWLALRAAPGIGDVRGRALAMRFAGALGVLAAAESALVAAGCSAATARRLHDPAIRRGAREELERIVAAGARLVALDAVEYPAPLREIHDAPLHLVAKGNLLDAGPAVAIVGARRATSYGRETAHRLAAGLADAGVTVVSGLARGIDGAAHEGALAARGRTVAVLGSGIDVVYPREHAELAARIIATGTLLSEQPVGAGPLPDHFPARNRILAGMTQGTVVIEAAERSGSLITARLANEQGREVFAVPGRIDSPLSAGAHQLIREGATLVRDLDDVLAEIEPALRGRAADGGSAPGGPAGDAEAIAGFLVNGPLSTDDLVRASGRSPQEVIASLLDLELRGVVRRGSGGHFQLAGRFAGVAGLQ